MPAVLILKPKDKPQTTPGVGVLREFIVRESKDGKLPAEVSVQNGYYAATRDACLALDVGFVGTDFPNKFNFREPWMNGGEVIISEAPNE